MECILFSFGIVKVQWSCYFGDEIMDLVIRKKEGKWVSSSVLKGIEETTLDT